MGLLWLGIFSEKLFSCGEMMFFTPFLGEKGFSMVFE